MEIQDIIISNKLIAKFMQYDDVDCHNCKYTRDCNWIQCGLTPKEKDEQLNYHSSWDWLMSVVEKIENTKPFYSVSNNAGFWYNDETDTVDRNKLQYLCIISDKSCRIVINSANYFPERNNKLVATWFAVVEFIKWYNSCQK